MVQQFWIIAGINGAGKTTFTQKNDVAKFFRDIPFLNADDRTLELIRSDGYSGFSDVEEKDMKPYFIRAANEVEKEVIWHLDHGLSIGVESVISGDKYKRQVLDALQCRYFSGMIYVALRSVDVAIQRVAERVSRGGHNVPEEKIRQRWERSLDNLAWFADKVDRLLVFDNTDEIPENDVLLIAEAAQGEVTVYFPDAIPEITRRLVALK